MEHIADKRILLTRADDDNGPWVERLISLGAEPVPFPCISIEELDPKEPWAGDLQASSWIAFTSPRSVRLFAKALGDGNLSAHQIAAVGPATAAACIDRFGRCDLTSKAGTGAALAELLTPKLATGAGVLIPGAAEPRPELAEKIKSADRRPIPMPLYATRPRLATGDRVDFLSAGLDAVLFASPSAVSGCFGTADIPVDLPAGCIGPTTSAAAQASGMTRIAVSSSRDLDGLLLALKDSLTP